MERHIHQQLEEVRQSLLAMGGKVEEMIGVAIAALVERDRDKARAVIARDRDIDELEVSIDHKCRTVWATQQPTAVDLRFLIAVTKITNELERIGDSAVNIAQSAEILADERPLKPYVDVPRLTEIAQSMVRDALDALMQRDTAKALEVCARDDRVDALYNQLFRELVKYMAEDPRTVGRALQVLLVTRNLERIADHATNVAEDVIYYVEGRDIRHSGS